MSALENSIFIEILKENVIFLTHISDILLRVLCYTLLHIPRYENH
jgi:hypothetical protein